MDIGQTVPCVRMQCVNVTDTAEAMADSSRHSFLTALSIVTAVIASCLGFHRVHVLKCHASRPREKIHRPQTRRRRDNNEESIDKLKTIRANLAATRDLCEAVARREQRKLNIMVCLQRLLGQRAVSLAEMCCTACVWQPLQQRG